MTTIDFDTNALKAIVARASRKAMYRAAGYTMTVARRKIRHRSYKVASTPGMPPYKHRRGANDFSHSIRFAVDPAGTTAVIGPQRESKSANLSGTVPHTLEFGGMTRAGRNILWFRKSAPAMTTESAVTSYFQRSRFAPLYMGTSASAVRHAARSKKSLSSKKAPVFGRAANGEYKLVYYVSVRVNSERQARRSAKNVVQHFGFPITGAGRISPRPYMGSTLKESQTKILKCWQNVIEG